MIKLYALLISILLIQTTLLAKEKKKETYPSYKAGFQIVTDAAWFMHEKQTTENQEIRRARLYLKGKLLKSLAYEVEYSLTAGGKWKDLYLIYSALPNDLVLTLGHTKEPFGLEALTSSKYNTFMERALPDMFISDRKLGLLLEWEEHQKNDYGYGASIGLFGPSINDLDGKDGKDGKHSLAARAYHATYLNKKSFIHVGLSGAYNNIGDQKLKLSTRAESHQGSKILKSKIAYTDYTLRYGIEAVYQNGPFSLQSEYLYDSITTIQDASYNFSGWYAQASYFFTDDARRYKLKEGVYGRIKPAHPVGKDGIGAWEGALRISNVNLNNHDKTDGEAYEYTVGLNWYLIENMRVMANYITTDLGAIETPQIIQLRLQYDF